MQTYISRPSPSRKTPWVPFFAAMSIMLATGSWAVMVALGVVGVSVSFWESVALFCLLRFFILPGTIRKGSRRDDAS